MFIDVILIVYIIITTHGDTLLAGFVVLPRTEARLLKNHKKMYLIFHYYRVRKEKKIMMATIDVRAIAQYVQKIIILQLIYW